MMRSLSLLLAGCLAMGIFLWVALPGAGIAQAAPGGFGRSGRLTLDEYSKIRPDSESVGDAAYRAAIAAGDSEEEAARKAGSAAGRKAAYTIRLS